MSHTKRGSGDMMSLKDQEDSSSFDETNSSQKSGGGLTSLKKGPWASAEDAMLVEYVRTYGENKWNFVQKQSRLSRCGKSCRQRWANHLRPNLKKGPFTLEEERLVIKLHSEFGNKWARMATHLQGRTDNDIKNYWNTRIKKHKRAGLPLYPPGLYSQTLNGSLQVRDPDEFNDLEPQNQGAQNIPGVIINHFKGNKGVESLPPTIPNIPSANSMFIRGPILSQMYGLPPLIPTVKQLRPDTFLPDISFGANGFAQFDDFQNGMFENNNHAPYAAMLTNPFPLSNNFVDSKLPLELPLLHYPDHFLGNWKATCVQPALLNNIDGFLQSPSPDQIPNEMVSSNFYSPRNKGLLDAIRYKENILNNTESQSFEKAPTSFVDPPRDIMDSSVVDLGEPQWKKFVDPIFPLGHFTTSVYTGCVGTTSSSQEQQALKALMGSYVESGPVKQVAYSYGMKESTTENNANEVLDIDWSKVAECFEDQPNIQYDLSTLIEEHICSGHQGEMDGTETLTFSQEFGCRS